MQDLQNALIALYFISQLQHSRFSALQNAASSPLQKLNLTLTFVPTSLYCWVCFHWLPILMLLFWTHLL